MADQRVKKYLSQTPIAPPKYSGRAIDVRHEADVNDVINTAIGILKQQVDGISAKSRLGGSLKDEEVKHLSIYVKCLNELSREKRERTKHDGVEEWVASLSTEELISMAQGKLATSATMDNALETTATKVELDDK